MTLALIIYWITKIKLCEALNCHILILINCVRVYTHEKKVAFKKLFLFYADLNFFIVYMLKRLNAT